MRVEEFDFDGEVLARATESQRVFATQVSEAIRSLRPAKLDLARTRASLTNDSLMIELIHVADPDQGVAAIIEADGAIVSYGVEHEHFWPEDIASGRSWPIDAPDFLAAALHLVEQLLLGRIELEVRSGRLMQKTRSYRITDTGERDVFLTSGTLLPHLHPRGPTVIRFDFGSDAASGPPS